MDGGFVKCYFLLLFESVVLRFLLVNNLLIILIVGFNDYKKDLLLGMNYLFDLGSYFLLIRFVVVYRV